MHVRELIELAGLVAQHGPLIVGADAITAAQLQGYWLAGKCRLDRWFRAIKAHNSLQSGSKLESAIRWGAIRPTLEEILAAEILTRAWTAVLSGHDARRGASEARPIAESVLLGHLEARGRALAIMVDSPTVGTEEAVALNRLRRLAERWTDLLLGALAPVAPIDHLAFDISRARDFATDLAHRRAQAGGRHAWPLMMVSLRGAFQRRLSDRSPNADFNLRIAESVLGCFSGNLFDSCGLPQSPWMTRLTTAAQDIEGLVSDMFGVDALSSADVAGGRAASTSNRRRNTPPRRFEH